MSRPGGCASERWHIMRWISTCLAALLAALSVIALRHALETPQPLQSQQPGEALLYRWRRHSIFYTVLGSSDAPPIVLLHNPAPGASAHEMQAILSPLAHTYRVYALDLLGFGLSDRPAEPYSASLYSAMCRDFLRDVVQRPATVLASGLSCSYAVSMASETSDLCASLVLLSPLALEGTRQAFPLRSAVELPLIKALLYPLLCTRLAFLLTQGRARGKQGDFAQFYAQTHQLGAEHAAMAWLAGKLAGNVMQQFTSLTQPTLLIWGMQMLENQRSLASMHNTAVLADPRSRVREVEIIQDAGNAPHAEQPANVVAAIQRWQAQTTGATPAITSPEERQGGAEEVPLTLPGEREEEQIAVSPSLPEKYKDVPIDEQERPLEQVEEEQETEAPEDSEPNGKAIMAYCVKCKQKREMLNAHEVTMKNGRRAVRGTCPVCGTGLNRIGGLL